MEIVVLVLMFLVMFMTWLKLSFLKAWHIAVISAVCSLFIVLTWRIAIEQSRNEISEWLGNQRLMLDTSVVLTVEVLWQMCFCLLSGKLLYGEKVGRRTIFVYRALRFFPGVLILPVLFYALIQAVYAFTGVSFSLVAWTMAAFVFLLMPSGAYAIRFLLPEKPLRLEILFLCASMILILGIIATVNGSTTFKGSDPIEWAALGTFALIALVCGTVGFLIRQYKIRKSN